MKKEIRDKGSFNDLTALSFYSRIFQDFSRINASLLSPHTIDLKEKREGQISYLKGLYHEMDLTFDDIYS